MLDELFIGNPLRFAPYKNPIKLSLKKDLFYQQRLKHDLNEIYYPKARLFYSGHDKWRVNQFINEI